MEVSSGMPWTAFAFLAGDILFQHSAQLPPAWGIAAGGLLTVLAGLRWGWRWWLGFSLGWLWAAGFALWHRVPELPDAWIGTTVEVRLTIVDLPLIRPTNTRLTADISSPDRNAPEAWRVSLSWRDAPELRAGQVWKTQVRLKPTHSFQNPGSRDYAGWLYHRGIRYRGYVTGDAARQLDGSGCCWLDRMRQTVRDRLSATAVPPSGKALLYALVLGDRSATSHSMRSVAAATGVSHLLAISGLHISLVGGLVALMVNWGWRRLPACQRVPAIVAGAIAGLGAATVYAMLSGFGLPARRALLMLAIAVVLLSRRRAWSPWRIYALALLAVLLSEPTAVLEAGFWLSFVAVAAILALLPHVQGRPWWYTWPVMQTGIAVALYPVLFAFDMPSAPLGILVNLLLVPLFSLLLIPAALLGTALLLLPGGPSLPLEWVGRALAWTWSGLEWGAQWTPHLARPAWSPVTLSGLALAAVLLLLPPGIRSRVAGLVLLVACHLPRQAVLPDGAFRLDVLDVGQGLATVIRTRHHRLIYDTGAAYPSGFNLADAVLLPWLQHNGLHGIDLVVLSHGDNDHAGAAARLLQGISAGRVLSGEPGRVDPASERCPSDYFWRWDGVVFGFIQPPVARTLRGNNTSCVLLVRGRGGSALLTGDAERRIEQLMIYELKSAAPVDVVVAGHHGSATSSSEPFVQAVEAAHVIYSAGYRNRYGFPKAVVDRRWAEAGARRWRTDGCGLVAVDFPAQAGEAVLLRPHAPRHSAYWAFPDIPCEVTRTAPSSMIRGLKKSD